VRVPKRRFGGEKVGVAQCGCAPRGQRFLVAEQGKGLKRG